MHSETTYGICRLSIVPVRKSPSDTSEMVTQLLFGDAYQVKDRLDDKKWIQIVIDFDGYTGWIDQKQHHGISEAQHNHISQLEYKISTDVVASLLYKHQLLNIVLGSMLPISSSELFPMQEKFAFNGGSKNLGQRTDFEYLHSIAFKYLHTPYLWGGKSPFGIDCSGFTQQVFKICGYKLERDACDQYRQGTKISSVSNALPGDLAFFENDQKKITHVGIILENMEIIHASGSVRVDKLDEKGIFNIETNGHTHKLNAIKRMMKI